MKRLSIFLLANAIFLSAIADVRLPGIFGNHMVLQRGKVIPVWGWATPGEKVTVQFHDQLVKTKAGKNGKWQVALKAETAGGPYNLTVSGKNKLSLTDVLVGEVWICSGQSNMEMNVRSSKDAEKEMAAGTFPQIRHIKVPNRIAASPQEDFEAREWQVGSPETVGEFTAVGYFFARRLYKELNVPIGLINASWGGSMIETWISREAMQRTEDFRNVFDIPFTQIESNNEEKYQNLVRQIESMQGSLAPDSQQQDWISPVLDVSNWKTMALPSNFEDNKLAKFDGKIWFRKSIELDKSAASKPAVLNLSTIDDNDETYVNGVLVGKSNAYDVVRQYTVPAGVLREGSNIIAIRVADNYGNGGFFGKPAELNLACHDRILPLSGDWSYKIEALNRNAVGPNDYPSLLFNSMIKPLVPFAISGVLWYQGETNAGRAYQYRNTFPLMIKDWRSQFGQGDFPFYFVQLASFSAGNGNSVNGSTWAELREAQTRTLSLPNTGMAVTLDIGETNDIHPKNKQDVGERLAGLALHQLYGKPAASAGPVYQSMKVEGSNAILTFTNVDSGYLVKDRYGYIKGFEVAGADKKFCFARAHIDNGKVVVYSDSVKAPVAVRYGWADDMPEANLYNAQGLPAVPFRTDTWPGITDSARYTISVE